MSEQLPAPLVPPEVDLRGYDFMPLYGHRLLSSEFNTLVNDAEFRAGVMLWWAAWNQVPAASLPDNDSVLCRLADMGRDLRRWAKVRENALHGLVKCSDGRLYHKALAQLALEAWGKRIQDREKKRKWREKRRGQDGHDTGDTSVDGTTPKTGPNGGAEPGHGGLHRLERRGEERRGEDTKKEGGGSARASGDADLVLQHFLAQRNRLWPSTSRLVGPHMTIRAEAQQLLDRSAPPELLNEILTRGMEATARAGKQPPSTLKAYQDSLADGVAGYLQRMPDGNAADPFGLTNGAGQAQGSSGFKSRAQIHDEQQAVLRRRMAEEEAAEKAAAEGGQSW